jgi:hypothetical protein
MNEVAGSMSDNTPKHDETYSDAETRRRADTTLKRMLETPPKPHKDSKLGKRAATSRKPK